MQSKNGLVSYVYRASNTGPSFDYSSVETSVATFLKGQANRIRRSFTQAIVQIGKDLIEAKRYLTHGQFLRWVEAEVGIPSRTAQVYMRAAEWSRDKGAIVAHLPPTLIYLLSAPSTPEGLTKTVLRRIEEEGEIKITAVREELKKLKMRRDSNEIIAADEDHSKSDGQTAIIEAVTIICKSLSETDFHRVRTLLTDKTVLRDPALSEKIAAAFCERGGLLPGNLSPKSNCSDAEARVVRQAISRKHASSHHSGSPGCQRDTKPQAID